MGTSPRPDTFEVGGRIHKMGRKPH